MAAGLIWGACGGSSGGGGSTQGTISSQNYNVSIASVTPNLNNATPGQSLTVSLVLTNQGNVNAANFSVGVYLSQSPTITQSSISLASQTVASLPAGQSTNISIPVTIPSSATAGSYYLLAQVNLPSNQSTNSITYAQLNVFTINTTSAGVAVLSLGNQAVGLVPNGATLVPVPLNPGVTTAASYVKSKYMKASPVSCTAVVQGSTTQGFVCSVTNSPTASFSLNSCAVDPVNEKLVCIGYGSQSVAVFDLSKYISTLNPSDITEKECNLAPGYTIPSVGFSGGSCTDCGVATDPANDRFIVSSGDGFRVVGYSFTNGGACDVEQTYLLSNYGIASVNENFAYDPTRQWIINPEYNDYSGNAKFWIIDLKNGNVYSWTNTLSCSVLDPNNPNCSLDDIDSAAIDPSTGIVMMADEFSPYYILFDMGQSTFSSTNTFSAPYYMLYLSGLVGGDYTGTAIDPNSHIAFIEQEFGNGIVAVQLPTSSGTAGVFPASATWQYAYSIVPSNSVCSNPNWYNPGDPHGLSVFTTSSSGTPYGMVMSGDKSCIVVVNLEGFLNSATAGSNYVDPNSLLSNGDIYFIGINTQ